MEEHLFRFSNLSTFPELVHAVSNRHFGDMKFGRGKDAETVKNREQFLKQLDIDIKDVVAPSLVHSNQIVVVGREERGKGSTNPQTALLATDGLITTEKEVYLLATFADCLPVLMYDPVSKTACLLHAGWRGIVSQMVHEALNKLKKLSVEPQSLFVGVGPGICQKHFVVRKNVLSLFLDYCPQATLVRNNDGYVDLKKVVMLDLKRFGVSLSNIEISNVCTVCENGKYGSYRKEGENVPAAAAVIGIKA